jgi:hypothetical protein
MKTPKKSTTSKLIARFDNELKNILMNDLSAVRNTRLINTIQNNLNNRLNAA